MSSQSNKNKELLKELELLKAENASLRIENNRLLEKRDQKFEQLFDIFPIAISENDFTSIKLYFDALRKDGVVDIKSYFNQLPNRNEEIFRLMRSVKMLRINKEHFRIHGVTPDQYDQLMPTILSSYGNSEVEEYVEQFTALFNGSTLYMKEMPPYKTLDGLTKNTISYLVVPPECQTSLSSVFVAYIDITEQKQAEAALRANELILKALNADKDKFISILAHDLRSPFNSILGLLQVITSRFDGYSKEELFNHLQMIYKSANGVFELLEDILLWVKSQSGKIPFEPKNVCFTELYNSTIVGLKPIADNKKISILYTPGEDTLVVVDIDMMKTILRNLITNAIKFSNTNGEIEIKMFKENAHVIISIIDNGVGINPELAKTIFELALKHSTPGTNQEKGSGLGLLLCKDFVERHGGHIIVDSHVGYGSAFTVVLPN